MTAEAFQRERVVALAGLAAITALAWLFVFYTSTGAEMAMPAEIGLIFALWLVMMVAMMVPSVSPTLLMFTSIVRSREQNPFARAGIFLIGYLFIWSGFSVVAALAQLLLHDTISTNVLLSSALLVAAGFFQFTPLKRTCLTQCRSPQGFFITEWREGERGAFVMGLKHGAFCLGCCWLLMSLLFVVGVMNALWMAAIAIFILVEKVAPAGVWLSRGAGLLLIGAGAWMIAGGLV